MKLRSKILDRTIKSGFDGKQTKPEGRAGFRLGDDQKRAVTDFVRRKLEALGVTDKKTIETAKDNAMIVLGDVDAISKRNVAGGGSFKGLLMDAKQYYAVVFGYYNPDTDALAYFSGRRPDDESLRAVRFIVDLDRKTGVEFIKFVRFDTVDPEVPALKALEGLPVRASAGAIVDLS